MSPESSESRGLADGLDVEVGERKEPRTTSRSLGEPRSGQHIVY